MKSATCTPPHLRAIIMVLVTAAAYYVTGRLGLLLAIPPGYATAIWPPSGIALAACLLYGYGVWPGVVLGSVLVNIGTSFEAATVAKLLTSVALATSIGLGAALQAMVGAYLVRRFVGFPSALIRERDIGAFLVLGGPVSCLVNATIGVTTLWVGGVIPLTLYPFSWGTWWVGDIIGVLIITPLVLIWTAEPRQLWRRRRLSLALPLTGAFALAVIFFVYTSVQERQRLQLLFARQTDTLAQALKNRLEDYLNVLYYTEHFFASSREVHREEFRTFVQHSFARYPGLQALSLDRRVAAEQRATYEEAVRREGYLDFQITEQGAPGRLVRAAQRPEYVVVTYIEPYAGNEKALGFDVASEPGRLATLHRARDTGEPGATGRLMLVQETERQFGWLVFMPIYGNELPHATVEERRRSLSGYVTGVFRIVDMVEAAQRGLDRQGIVLRIEDATAAVGEQLLYDSRVRVPGRTGPEHDNVPGQSPAGMHLASTVELAGRHWVLRFTPALEFLAARQSAQPWTVLVGGLSFTGLLGAFLLIITGRATLIEQRVDERTAELSQMNTALGREIAERHQAESRFFSIAQSAVEAIISADCEGRILTWNNGAYAIFGYTADEIVGQPLVTLMPLSYREAHQWGLERMRLTGESRFMGKMLELSGRRKDGQEFPVELTLSTWTTSEGRFYGGIIRDITERKRAEAALQRTVAELTRSNADLQQFAYAASHDLQEPIRAMAGCAQLLELYYHDRLDARANQLIAHVVTGATRLQTLIHDLLIYAQVSTRRESLEPTDCERLLQGVLANLAVAIAESGAVVTSEPLPTVLADPLQLLLVFQNLISNAIKFRGQPPPAIHLGAQRRDEEWVFTVCDNGIGIEPQYFERIFRMFHRLHTRQAYPGTGMGLAMCQKIVERHGGRIWVTSQPGRGATFAFTLPDLR